MTIIARPLLVLSLVLAAASVRAQDIAPEVLVKTTTDDIVAHIRKDKELTRDPQKLQALVDAKVLPHFNFTRMTMLAVGRPWRDATPAQREELVKQFRTLLVRTYSTALEQYSSQTIEVKPAAKSSDTDATVRMQINQPGGQPIPMDYRMEKTPQGWKVYDVSVEGVSIVTTYRSTFAAEVGKGGIDGLIKTITDQNVRLAQRGGTAK